MRSHQICPSCQSETVRLVVCPLCGEEVCAEVCAPTPADLLHHGLQEHGYLPPEAERKVIAPMLGPVVEKIAA